MDKLFFFVTNSQAWKDTREFHENFFVTHNAFMYGVLTAIIVALVLGGILRSMLGRLPGSLVTGGFVALIAWFMFGAFSMALIAGVVALVVALSGMGLGRHGFGGYSSGGHGGGGGFSGGGGGFGGGGSSGRW